MVANDHEQRVPREALGDLFSQQVDEPQMQPPVVTGDPAGVAGEVQVAMVGIHQGPRRADEVAQRHGGQLPKRVNALVAAAPQHRPCQSRTCVVPRADQVDADAVGGGALERGGLRLEPLGRDAVAQVGRRPEPRGRPAQQVHRSRLPGHRHRCADQAVLTGWLAGTEGTEAGHGGGREAGRDRP